MSSFDEFPIDVLEFLCSLCCPKVRLVCRSLRECYDSCNKSMRLQESVHGYTVDQLLVDKVSDLLQRSPRVREMTIVRHKYYFKDSNAIMTALAFGVQPLLLQKLNLQVLNLARNQMGTEGIRAFVNVFESLKSLTSLDLSSNFIGAGGAAVLAPALLNLKKLHSLNLSYNRLGAHGAAAIAPSLRKLEKLASLAMCYNYIGAVGAASFAYAIKDLKQLRSLDMRYNSLGEEGVAAVGLTLRELKELTLDVRWNKFG